MYIKITSIFQLYRLIILNQQLEFNHNQKLSSTTKILKQKMIKRIFNSNRLAGINLLPQGITFGFVGFEPRIDHSLVSNINEVRSLEELFNYYIQNKSIFNPYLYSVFCRKVTRLLKDRVISRGIKLKELANFKVFMQELSKLNFQQIAASQIKSILFMLRIFNMSSNYSSQLLKPIEIQVTKRIEVLVIQNAFSLNELINVLYDLCSFASRISIITDKIEEILLSNQEQHIEQKNKLEPYHIFLGLKSFNNRIVVTKKQQRLIGQFCNFIDQRLKEIPLADTVKIMVVLNQLKLRNINRPKGYLLHKLVDKVYQNVNQLEISSIFNILNFRNDAEDNLFSKIYQTIQNNLYSSINEAGQSFIEPKVLMDCLRQLSSKQNLINKPTKVQLFRLLVLVERYLKMNDKKIVNIVTWELGMLLKKNYLTLQIKKKLYEIILRFVNHSINYKLICEMSNQKFDMTPFLKNIDEIDFQKNTSYSIEIANAIKIQSQYYPNDQNLKNKLELVKSKLADIDIKDVKTMVFMKQPEAAYKFHLFFSDHYFNRISKNQLTKRENIYWYIKYLVMVTNKNEKVTTTIGQFTEEARYGYTGFFRICERQHLNTLQLFNTIILVQDLLPFCFNKKCQDLLYYILQFISNNQVKSQASNHKFFESYCHIFNMISQNLLINIQGNSLQSYFNKIEMGKSRRISCSLQYFNFLKRCKQSLFKINEPKTKKALAIALMRLNLISQDQINQLGIYIDTYKNTGDVERTKISSSRLQYFLNTPKQLEPKYRQLILDMIPLMKNPRDIEQAIVNCRIPNSIQIREILQKLIEQLIIINPKWQYIKVFAIIRNLKKEYKMKNNNSFRNLLRKIIELPSFQSQMTLIESIQILKQCIYANIEVSKQVERLQKYYVQHRMKKFKQYEFLLKTASKSTPQFLQVINYFPRRSLRLLIIAENQSENQFENPEQRFKNLIQDKNIKGQEIQLAQKLYISKKYPNLKSLLNLNDQPNQKIMDLDIQQSLKQIQIQGKINFNKASLDKLNSYYQFNETAIFSVRNIKVISDAFTNIQLAQKIMSVIIEKPVIVYKSKFNLINRLIEKFPQLQKLKDQSEDKNIQQEPVEQMIEVAEELLQNKTN